MRKRRLPGNWIVLPALWNKHRQKAFELTRFCFVGIANTAIYYLFYRLILLALPYLAAHVAAWFIATVASFLMNCVFVFKVRPTLRRFVRFPAAPLTNLFISTVGSILLISSLGVSEKWGTLIAGIIAVPLTFTVARIALRSPRADKIAGSSQNAA